MSCLSAADRIMALVDLPLPASPTIIMPWRTNCVSCTWGAGGRLAVVRVGDLELAKKGTAQIFDPTNQPTEYSDRLKQPTKPTDAPG